jgi:hypothetical protein
MNVPTAADYGERATFYRAALLLGLIRGDLVIAWADEVLASDGGAPPAFSDIATTPADDLTQLRQRLLLVGSERESDAVVRAITGLVHRDLASGRRTMGDTMTVLKQLRAFIKVTPALNDRLKTLGVDVAVTTPGSHERADAEARVRDWLAEHERDALPFLEP